MGRFQLTLEL